MSNRRGSPGLRWIPFSSKRFSWGEGASVVRRPLPDFLPRSGGIVPSWLAGWWSCEGTKQSRARKRQKKKKVEEMVLVPRTLDADFDARFLFIVEPCMRLGKLVSPRNLPRYLPLSTHNRQNGLIGTVTGQRPHQFAIVVFGIFDAVPRSSANAGAAVQIDFAARTWRGLSSGFLGGAHEDAAQEKSYRAYYKSLVEVG